MDVPDTNIDYPTIDVPTEESFQGDMSQPQEIPQEENQTRVTTPNPTINVGGLDIPLPKPEVAVTSATTACDNCCSSLLCMLVQQMKTALTPL